MSQKPEIDMVTMSIIDSTMTSICREMGITLMKTSYSTIFNEALDFTCAMAGPDGQMIAQAEFCPSMIGGVPLLSEAVSWKFRSRNGRRAMWSSITIPIAVACTRRNTP